MEETRREQVRVDCDLILNKIEAGHRNICRATNISLSGMQLVRLLEPQVHVDNEESRVRLQFALPGQNEALDVEAERIYDDQDGLIGVRFVNISHQHFVQLRDWIRERTEFAVPMLRGA